MQNAVIRWVVILGAVALVGIIGIQSYWVMTTWDLNEEEFNKKKEQRDKAQNILSDLEFRLSL